MVGAPHTRRGRHPSTRERATSKLLGFCEVYGKIKDKLEDCQMVNACAAAGEELSLETVTAVAQRVVVWGGFAATGCASSELWCGRLAFCRAVEVDLEVCMCVGVCAGWMGKETRVLLNVSGGRC